MLIDHSKLPWMKNWEERHQAKLRESIRKSLMLRTPTTDEELWMVCGYRWGLWFARKPLTPENDPPFRFLADAYFERWDRMFGMAAKGTGKTAQFAVLHQLNSENKPGTWTAHVGAIERQAMRCNDYVQQALEKESLIGKEVENVLLPIGVKGDSMRSLRKWRNGSRLEILAGTIGQVSGIHPQVGAMDEFELGTWEVWEHFGKALHASPIKRAQMILGSTRFRARGPVDRILTQKKGVFKVIRWSIYDAMAKCTMDCHKDPEWGTCPLYSRQQVQPDGSTQEVKMCHGRAHEGVGHMSRDEVLTAYLMGDMLSWGTLMELDKPTTEGLFFPELQVPDPEDAGRETMHVRSEYEYVPGRPVYLGYDDGFAWPLVLGAWQMRDDGFLYQFDELYLRRALPSAVIEELDKKEWIEDVEIGWPDPSARAAIQQYRDWFQARLGRPVMVWNTDNDRINGWKAVRRRLWTPPGVPMLGYHPRCSSTYGDVAGLAKLEGSEDCQKIDDHGGDQTRYLVYNLDRYLGIQARAEGEYRPEGGVETARKAIAARTESEIRERYDKLVKLGVKPERLKQVEEGMGPARREEYRRALGSWLAEMTTSGRLQRAGLVRDDPDDLDRPV